ncbi:MAG: phosphoglycerate dehydrogenase [Rhodospirillales bacterium]|jgi:D-3-phosphoglycerate dehydrogenase|nr:hydroxyacid dehydrogenase [Rhodospirillaceae bacterium]MDP6427076.1 phosphoglycerate dehydrogenase [Rhodospirillales bacterium]MDP6645252.1 phosphoglycerate dehydrogenase [Rhodospirillales bacterium]MDP6841872.1 phosphoglycerate dehydrogenase [Rhodospirillales bacterium]|tara:strand:+ start:371 stop:1303 length:933 start_codon:yes stop_codon:yes gene_type:complete
MSGPVVKVASRSFSKNPVLRREITGAFPEVAFNESGATLSGDGLVDFFKGIQGAVIGLEPITGEFLDQCPDLKIVSKYGVGLDSVDREACDARGVAIGWTGGVNRRGVAEMALCMMIGLMRNIFFSERRLLGDGNWEKDGGTHLSGHTVGIIGVGFIGKDLAQLLRPFGCRILVNDIIDQAAYYDENGLIEASKEEIFENADIVTVHTPLDDSTRGMIDMSALRRMKETAYLINVARGGIVEQADLKQALKERIIAGAALDVFEVEPCDDVEFLTLPNLYCTPHTGGSAEESILAMGRSAIGHLVQHFKG